MTGVQPQNLVLAVYPSSRGFAFIFFEGPEGPYDWGVKDIRAKTKSKKTFKEIRRLIDRYRPEVLVIEETGVGGWRRTSRIRKLYRGLIHLAEVEYIDVYRCSKDEVKRYFSLLGATTKHEIACALAAQIPALSHRLPRARRPWTSEDPRQSLFDAAALALAYYSVRIKSLYVESN